MAQKMIFKSKAKRGDTVRVRLCFPGKSVMDTFCEGPLFQDGSPFCLGVIFVRVCMIFLSVRCWTEATPTHKRRK